jgi:hypothetical protein
VAERDRSDSLQGVRAGDLGTVIRASCQHTKVRLGFQGHEGFNDLDRFSKRRHFFAPTVF